jgi:hypothetical protein
VPLRPDTPIRHDVQARAPRWQTPPIFKQTASGLLYDRMLGSFTFT